MGFLFRILESSCVYLHFTSSADTLWVHVNKEYSQKNNNKKGELCCATFVELTAKCTRIKLEFLTLYICVSYV